MICCSKTQGIWWPVLFLTSGCLPLLGSTPCWFSPCLAVRCKARNAERGAFLIGFTQCQIQELLLPKRGFPLIKWALDGICLSTHKDFAASETLVRDLFYKETMHT